MRKSCYKFVSQVGGVRCLPTEFRKTPRYSLGNRTPIFISLW